jgi:hypothetical protein
MEHARRVTRKNANNSKGPAIHPRYDIAEGKAKTPIPIIAHIMCIEEEKTFPYLCSVGR